MAALGCSPIWTSSDDAHAAPLPPTDSPNRPADTGPTPTPGYPVDTSPPKDFFSDALLRTLAREASASVVCKLKGLTDVFADKEEPDVFYDAACEVTEVRTGSVGSEPLHFIWQVERGARMPPPGSELLVYLKLRKQPLDGPLPLKWVALDTGVMRYTDALRRKLGQAPRRPKKGK